MNISITIYPRIKQPTIDEIIDEFTRKKIQYIFDNGVIIEENQATPETLNILYAMCYPTSHIQNYLEEVK